MFSLLKNKLYRFNIWLDRHELFKFIFMIFYILVSVGNIQFGNLFLEIIMLLMLSLYTFFRMFVMNGKIKFNRSKYDVPLVGETLVVTKTFYWDGSFRKFINPTDPSRKPWWYTLPKGKEMRVLSILKVEGDWEITLTDEFDDKVVINYFESRKYWRTKTDIRDEKLRRIGI